MNFNPLFKIGDDLIEVALLIAHKGKIWKGKLSIDLFIFIDQSQDIQFFEQPIFGSTARDERLFWVGLEGFSCKSAEHTIWA